MRIRRLLTPRWLLRHTAVVVLVVAFCALAGWQFGRATGGNTLSWGYTLEWPLFAGFVVAMWVRAVRDELRSPGGGGEGTAAPISRPPISCPVGQRPQRPDPVADELDSYNDYLAWLNANPGRRPGDYPG
jgi:hypothetical protein